jgi:hypothetical protein
MSEDNNKPSNILNFKICNKASSGGDGGDEDSEVYISCPECEGSYWIITSDYTIKCSWCHWELEEDF